MWSENLYKLLIRKYVYNINYEKPRMNKVKIFSFKFLVIEKCSLLVIKCSSTFGAYIMRIKPWLIYEKYSIFENLKIEEIQPTIIFFEINGLNII